MEKEIRLTARPLEWFLFLSPFLGGGFFEWTSCLFAVFLAGYLLYCRRKRGALLIVCSPVLFLAASLAACYGIGSFWAVDRGMALLGFCKFLPLPLFVLVVMQIEKGEREKLLDTVPVSGGVMTVLSFGLRQLFPVLWDRFYVGDRLAGFFQYPNTFALFLLVGIILLAGKERWSGIRFLNLAVLVAGIALSGSRTVFFLLGIVAIVFCFVLKGKVRWALCLGLAALVGATVFYVALTGKIPAMGRYLTASLHSSTFLGRMLYAKDALPVIARTPFGLGYMGYFYTQGSFQTGVYSVLNVHNELLQLFLDVGWIPAVVAVVILCRSFIRQETWNGRLLLAVLAAHSMLDFDLQFVCIWFVLFLIMKVEGGQVWTYRGRIFVWAGSVVVMGFCLWLGIGSYLYRSGRIEEAVKVYPGCTGAWISMLAQTEDVEEMERIADEILSRNQSVSIAHSAKARAAYARGDFETVISCKQRAISLARYELDEYLDYFQMLYVGFQMYLAGGDLDSARVCRQKLSEIPDMLEEALERTDGLNALAWKIRDKPELVLPKEYQEILDSLQ
ncbi:MAG: hypothetical protein HFI63_05410 [Lachnospiraceae bacterium]|nr:hypothetical protein [Lachnospiraceae bacterium]